MRRAYRKMSLFLFSALLFCIAVFRPASAVTVTTAPDLSESFEAEGISWNKETGVLALNGASLDVGSVALAFPGSGVIALTGENHIRGSVTAEGSVTLTGTGTLVCENGGAPVFSALSVSFPQYLVTDGAGVTSSALSDTTDQSRLTFRRAYSVTQDATEQYEYNVGTFFYSVDGSEKKEGKKISSVLPGQRVTLSFEERQGFLFERWETEDHGLDIFDRTQKEISFTMPERDVALFVRTSQITYHFRAETNGGGTIIVEHKEPDEDGLYSFFVTDRFEIVAVPDQNHIFSGWSATAGAGIDDFSSESTFLTVPAEDFVLRAQFASSIRKLTLEEPEGGSVSPKPGIYDYGVDSILDLVATPEEGWAFSHWETSFPGGGFADPKAQRTTFTMPDSDCVIRAVFLKGGYRLGKNLSNGGTVVVAEGVYEMGAIVPVRAEAAPGYRFDHWESTAEGVFTNSKMAECEVIMPAQSVNIWAVFVLDTHEIPPTTAPPPTSSLPEEDAEEPFPWLALIVIFLISALVVTLVIIRDRKNVSYRFLIKKLFRRK